MRLREWATEAGRMRRRRVTRGVWRGLEKMYEGERCIMVTAVAPEPMMAMCLSVGSKEGPRLGMDDLAAKGGEGGDEGSSFLSILKSDTV